MQQQPCIVYACLVCFLYNFVTGGSNMDCLDYWRELYIMFMKETFVMGTLGALSCYSCGWMKRLRIGVEVKGTSDGWHLVTSDKWGLGPGDWGTFTNITQTLHTDTQGTIGRALSSPPHPKHQAWVHSPVLLLSCAYNYLQYADSLLEIKHKYEKDRSIQARFVPEIERQYNAV